MTEVMFISKSPIVKSDQEPADKTVLWFDTNVNKLKYWNPNSNQWEEIGDMFRSIYDADADNVIDLDALPLPPLSIKKRSDGSFVKLEFGTITTLGDGQALDVTINKEDETTYTLASYLNENSITSTYGGTIYNDWVDDYDFGAVSNSATDINELKEFIIKLQFDLKAYGYTINTAYGRYLENGVEVFSTSVPCDYSECGVWKTKSYEYRSTNANSTFKTQIKTSEPSEGYITAYIRNRYIYQKEVNYKIVLSN